jgi:hypothetical protein
MPLWPEGWLRVVAVIFPRWSQQVDQGPNVSANDRTGYHESKNSTDVIKRNVLDLRWVRVVLTCCQLTHFAFSQGRLLRAGGASF